MAPSFAKSAEARSEGRFFEPLVHRMGSGVRYLRTKVYLGKRSVFLSALSAAPCYSGSPMFSSRCVFCGSGNPAGAKFCNECASPLHLKPCNECDAINDRSARSCYKCGADFPMERAIEGSPKAVTPDPDTAASTISAFEQKRQRSEPFERLLQQLRERRLHGSAADPVDTLKRRPEAPHVVADEVEFFAHNRPPGTGVTASFASQRVAEIIPVRARETRALRYLATRTTLATLLIVGVAIAGFFAYRHQAQDENAVKASQAPRGNGDATRTPASVGVSPRLDGSGGSSAAASIAAPTEDVASPMTQGRIRTTDTRRPEDKTNASADSAAAASSSPSATSNTQIAPGATYATPVDPGVRTTAAAKAIATQSHGKALQTPVRRSVAASSGSKESNSSFPDADALAVRAPIGSRRDDAAAVDRERLRSCTDDVAALGLCNRRAAANGEIK